MWLRMTVVLLALAFQSFFPVNPAQSLRQKYGRPVSESYEVRPGIVVTTGYGASGNICELVISSKQPLGMIKRWPGHNAALDGKLLKEIEEELVPTSKRGKFKVGTLLDITCLPENDCNGSEETWEKITIYANAGATGTRYEVIQWNRAECGAR
jgi:hypothetical protein